MKLTTRHKWLKAITWIRRNFPAEGEVYVRSRRLSKEHGFTTFSHGMFRIVIQQKQSFALRIETLIHEWAHTLSWFGAETHLDDHSAEWGLAYARIYRTFLEWDYGREFKPEEDEDAQG